MRAQITVHGLRATQQNMRRLFTTMRRVAFPDAMFAGSSVIAAEARRTATFRDRTGRLRASIRPRRLQGGAARAEARTPYARYIEFGTYYRWRHTKNLAHTGKVRARRFMYKAANAAAFPAGRAAVRSIRRQFPKIERAFNKRFNLGASPRASRGFTQRGV